MLAKQEWAISRLTVITFILRNASEITEADHVPLLGERIKTVSNWAKGSKALGWLGVFIDGGVRTNRVVEACQAGTSSECKKVTFREGGWFYTRRWRRRCNWCRCRPISDCWRWRYSAGVWGYSRRTHHRYRRYYWGRSRLV